MDKRMRKGEEGADEEDFGFFFVGGEICGR